MSRHPRIPQANPVCVSFPIRSSLRSLRKGPGLLSPPSASPVPTPTVSRTLLGNFEVVSLVSLGFCDSGALGKWDGGVWLGWIMKKVGISLIVSSHPRNHCCEDALHHLATLRASPQRLELVDPTAPSMSRCLSLSPSSMFLSKMPRPPSWYDLISTPNQLLKRRYPLGVPHLGES